MLRHAKSSWAESGLADHDRPLAPRGVRDARAVAVFMEAEGIAPGLVLCSSSRRTRETLELVAPSLGGAEVLIESGLYAADADQLLDRLRRVPDRIASLLLIGHNPGLEALVLMLAGDGEPRRRAEAKFPTAALASLAVPDSTWRSLGASRADLTRFVVPRELRK